MEFDWRWTVEKRASIGFELPETETDARICVFGHAAQRMPFIFLLNGREVHRCTLETETREICFHAGNVAKGKNVLEIIALEAKPFSERDSRVLGLAVIDLIIRTSPPRALRRTEVKDVTELAS